MSYRIAERRRAPRIAKSIPLKIKKEGFDIITETENLSSIGAYCKIPNYIEPLTKLKILLILPRFSTRKRDKKIECQGVVVRADISDNKFYNIAIFFNEIKERDKKEISAYVNYHLKNSRQG